MLSSFQYLEHQRKGYADYRESNPNENRSELVDGNSIVLIPPALFSEEVNSGPEDRAKAEHSKSNQHYRINNRSTENPMMVLKIILKCLFVCTLYVHTVCTTIILVCI